MTGRWPEKGQGYLNKKGGLKVKKRSLLIIVAMLSVLLFGIGTAYAVLGVNDDVPGQDVGFPIICGIQNTVDTAWAIADVAGTGGVFDILHNYQVKLHLVVHEPKTSILVGDKHFYLTPHDVLTDLCSNIVATVVQPAHLADITQTLCDSGSNCQQYYVAYVTYQQESPTSPIGDRLVSWVALDDLTNGYASGFNGVSFEKGFGPELEEQAGSVAIAARRLYPRYIINNDPLLHPQGHDWWIVMLGRADISTAFPNSNTWNGDRKLVCNVYDEDENVLSVPIPIPNELNVIDVDPYVKSLFASYSHNGFATCDIVEDGSQAGVGAFHNFGTVDNPTLVTQLLPDSSGYYTVVGWSHAKVQAASIAASWDVIWPMHRTECSPQMPAGSTAGDTPADNLEECVCRGASGTGAINGGGC
jgi:hypothetical protein